MQFCEQHPEIEGYFIYADDNGKMLTLETEGFKKYKK